MSFISLQDLTFAYPGSYDNVFEHVSLHWDSAWRLGLIGRNGRGKTTLLRLLRGEYPYQGKILAPAGFVSFPFAAPDNNATCRDFALRVCPQAEDWQLAYELAQLDVDAEVLARPYATLSPGEQTKLQLAAMFLSESGFPLIDEPTNHLDAAGRALLAAYLRQKDGFLLVSHDRALLDGCVDHILAINRKSIQVCRGNFSVWWQNKENQDKCERAENERLSREISQLEAAARRTAGWSDQVERGKRGNRVSGVKADKGHIGAQAARMMKRAKATEQRRARAAEEKAGLLHDIERTELLPIRCQQHHAAYLLELREIEIAYGARQVCGHVSFTLAQGERLALSGKNGSGKSSLLKLIAGLDIPHRGGLRRASQLKISYLPQQTGWLSGDLRAFIRAHDLDESLFKTILRKLDFERLQFDKDMAAFSEGQKKKVLLAKSLCEEAQLYLWDEPLNYIDVFSRMQIEEVLRLAKPTMILVEHDAAFLQAVATRRLAL